MPAVVQQGVHRLLQHAFLVAYDDFRSVYSQQVAQAVVAIDDAAVKVIQVRGGKTPALYGDQGSEVGRQHWQHMQDHPARVHFIFAKALEQAHSFGGALAQSLAFTGYQLFVKLDKQPFQVHFAQKLLDCLRSYAHPEGVSEDLAVLL